MSLVEQEKPTDVSGKTDFELYRAFKNGVIKKGTILEITTPEVPFDKEGKGALVVHVASAIYDYASPQPQFEHLVLSQDGKIDSIVQRKLTSWRVVEIMPEEEFVKRLSEVHGINTAL